MYKRDFGILFIAVCAIYLSLNNDGSFVFREAWYHRFVLDRSTAAGEHATAFLPRPIPADLNGDGKPEIIAAVPGGRIQVLAPREHGNGFAPALLLGEIDLQEIPKDLGKRDQMASHEVVASTVGYLTAKTTDFVRSPRKAAIGLVTSKGRVILLDHNLKILWVEELERNLSENRTWHVEQASILLTEHAANKGDKGMVVVGARMTSVDSRDIVDTLLEKHEGHGRERSEGLHEVNSDSLHQHSYYAFSGDTGKRVWQHKPSDYHPEIATFQDGSGISDVSLHAQAQREEGMHSGEASCRNYRESVLRALPHVWNAPYDSRLALSHFRRHQSHAGQQRHTVGQVQMNRDRRLSKPDFQIAVNEGSSQLGSGWVGDGKKVPFHPNVVLAHTEEGLEVFHLFSGRTVCRLPLQAGVVHADVNGDGIPDHIHAVGGTVDDLMREAASDSTDATRSHERLRFCSATVTSGIPVRYQLWNGTICRHTVVGLHSAARDGTVLGVAPPAVLPDYALRRRNNVFFLNSEGDLSGFSSWGELLWQVPTGATWNVVPVGEDGQLLMESDQEGDSSVGSPPDAPTLLAMSLRRHSTPTVVLAAGSSHAVIVSERGHILSSFRLPSAPEQPLVVADFNLDGYMDIVMVTDDGLYGWTQVRRPGSISYGALVACLIAAMLAVFVTQQSFEGHSGEASSEDGFYLKYKTAKGRSTDRID